MRLMTLAAAVFFAVALTCPASAEDTSPATDPARLAAARDLMDVTRVTNQLDGMIEAMTQGFAKGAKADSSEAGKKVSEEFQAAMKKFLSYKEDMLRDFAGLYAETFTADEMKQVADFYRSGTGAKFVQLAPGLMQKGAQIGIKYSERMVKEMSNTPPPADPK